MKHIRIALALFALLCVVTNETGCSPSREAREAAKVAAEATAEAKYTKALVACVETARTREESRECRLRVDADFGVSQTVTKDGGAK